MKKISVSFSYKPLKALIIKIKQSGYFFQVFSFIVNEILSLFLFYFFGT